MQAIATTQFKDLSSAGQNLSLNTVGIGMLIAGNSSGSTAFIQFFDSTAANVTIGTTRPLFVMVIASGAYDWLEFAPPLLFQNAASVFSTTTPEGSTASAAGVFLQAFVN
jgi:hypothetical protein